MEIGLSAPPALPGSGLRGWTGQHCPDQLMPTARDTPDGAPLPDSELGHCRPSSANQLSPSAQHIRLYCVTLRPCCRNHGASVGSQGISREEKHRGERRGKRQHHSHLVHSRGHSLPRGTFHSPLCGSSPPGTPASSRKSSRMPSCPASEHRILLWVCTSPSTVISLG